jgi:hypothetical protein
MAAAHSSGKHIIRTAKRAEVRQTSRTVGVGRGPSGGAFPAAGGGKVGTPTGRETSYGDTDSFIGVGQE